MVNETETSELPLGSTMTPSQVKKLKIAIAIMSVMLVAGFILLIAGIYMQTQKMAQKADDSETAAAAPGILGTIDIPAESGATLERVLVDRGTLILHLRQSSGDEVAIIDLETGREVQRFRLAPQESP